MMATKTKLLLVDDRPENLLALESVLRDPDLEFHRALSGRQALELLLVHDFALALIDVQMPEMDGFELAELMRGTDRTRAVPIIFVTAGVRDRRSTFTGYERGAVDFLHKPLDPHVVRSKVQIFQELARNRQALESQLHETRAALRERNEALRSRDEFLSIASHELKTPLTSLHLQHQLMTRTLHRALGENADPARLREALSKVLRAFEVCERQGGKLAELLDELLDLTRIRLGRLSLDRQEADLVAITKDVLGRFRAEADKKGYEVRLEAPARLDGRWDVTRLDQVVTNLFSNAIKYGEGRPIGVRLSTAANPRFARIQVEDHGIGVPENMREKIFERFERAVEGQAITGLGLGLYIARQIVEAHGGRIGLDSEVGRGSTFTVDLPRAET